MKQKYDLDNSKLSYFRKIGYIFSRYEMKSSKQTIIYFKLYGQQFNMKLYRVEWFQLYSDSSRVFMKLCNIELCSTSNIIIYYAYTTYTNIFRNFCHLIVGRILSAHPLRYLLKIFENLLNMLEKSISYIIVTNNEYKIYIMFLIQIFSSMC